jgi:hypothetical protein
MISLDHREFGYTWLELKLNPLEQHWMVDTPFRAPPGKNAVAKNQLHTLGFSLNPTM